MIDRNPPEVMFAGFTRPDTIRVAFNEHLLVAKQTDISAYVSEFSSRSFARQFGTTSTDTVSAILSCALGGSGCYYNNMHNNLVINGLDYRVTAPDGTNVPDDADGDPDVIELLPSGVRYWHYRSDLLVKLREPAASGVTYTLELPNTLVDYGGNQLADSAVEVTHAAGFTARTIDATTTIVTFAGTVGGSMSMDDWSLTSDEVLPGPWGTAAYRPLSKILDYIPLKDAASGHDVGIYSVTLGPPEDAPSIELYDKWFYDYRGIRTLTLQPSASSPSAWWEGYGRLEIPAASTGHTMAIKHEPIPPSSTLAVSHTMPYTLPYTVPRVYPHPGTADPETWPHLPFLTWVDRLPASAARAVGFLKVDGAYAQPGIALAGDAWPPTFTARRTSGTTVAIEFPEPVSGAMRVADWAISEGSATVAIQSVRVGEHSSPEDVTARAASATLSSATVVTLTHEAISQHAPLGVSYTRPAASATDAIADDVGNYMGTMTATAEPIVRLTDTTPPTFTALSVSASTIKITFDEPVSGQTAPGHWLTTGVSPKSLSVKGSPTQDETTLSGITELYLNLRYEMSDVRPIVAFYPPVGMTLADAAGNALTSKMVRAADGIPPMVTLASTSSASTVTLTFSEAVSGTTGIGEWRVAGSPPASLRHGDSAHSPTLALSGTTSLTLVTGMDLEPDSTPTVTYTPPGSAGITDTMTALSPSHETATPMAAQSLVAADGIAPAPTAAFVGPGTIAVTFDEALANPDTIAGLAYTVTVPDGAADADSDPDTVDMRSVSYYGATRALTLTLAADAATGVEHTVLLPTAGLADAAGNAVALTSLGATRAATSDSSTAFTARTANATRVVVTFDEPVSGAVAASQWTVAGTAVSSLRASQDSDVEATSLSGGVSLYLVTDPLAPYARPVVAFTPPETPTLANPAGNAIAAATVIAADGIAPAPTAAFVGPRTLAVTFDEALAAPGTVAGLSYAVTVPDDSTTVDEDGEPDAVAASSVSYAEASRALTLTLAADAATGVEHTVLLPTAGLADEAGNAVTLAVPGAAWSQSGAQPKADTTAPTFTARTISASRIEVTFSEPVTGHVHSSKWTIWGKEVPVRASPDSTSRVSTLSDATKLYLERRLASFSTPTIKYEPLPTRSQNALADAAGNKIPAMWAKAADGVGPSLRASVPPSFLDTSIIVTFDENVYLPRGTTLTATHATSGSVSAVPTRSGIVLALPLGANPAEGEWTVAIPPTLTDAVDNARTESAATATATYASPAPFTARTLNSTAVAVTFSAAPSGTLNVEHWGRSHPSYSGPQSIALGTSSAAPRATPGTPLAIPASSSETTFVINYSISSSPGDTPTIVYNAPASGGLSLGGAPLHSSRTIAVDGVPPRLWADTHSLTEVRVSVDDAVLPAGQSGRWTVDGTPVPPKNVRGLSLLLDHAPLASTGATPTVSYEPAEFPITDLAGNALEAVTVTAHDSIPPYPVASAPPYFSGTDIVMTFSEELEAHGRILFQVTHRETWERFWVRSTVSGPTVTVHLGSLLAEGTWVVDFPYNREYTWGYLLDKHGHDIDLDVASLSATYTAPTEFTARTANATLVEVKFGEPVTGAVAASQWTVAGTVVSSLRATQDSGAEATSLSGATSLYLVTAPLASGARPVVAFTPPETPTLAGSAGHIAATKVIAADGIAPTMASAVTASATSVTVTFSEAVSGPTAAGEWTVDGSQPSSLRVGTSQPSVAISASGMAELTLVVAGPLAPDSTPDVRYSPMAGTVGLTDTVAPTAPSHETATPMMPHSVGATDGIAPTPTAAFAGPRAITVTFDEALAMPATISGLAYAVTTAGGSSPDAAPDAVAVSVVAYDPASRTIALTLAADAPTGVEHAVTLPASGLADAAGNVVTLTSLAATRTALSDSSPTFTARTLNATRVEVTFDEPVTGAVAASQWTVAGTAASSLRASQGSEAEATSLSGAT
ncbi:MAG: hypothetical protein OXU61_13630, partial [Gammaproteobacteria bacterium]|nr:hypothetical protein [Gammaproteobacteria bacterium]